MARLRPKSKNAVIAIFRRLLNKNNMNEETYEALKLVVKLAYESGIQLGDAELENAINKVEAWIDEVAKEYNEDIRDNLINAEALDEKCSNCGEETNELFVDRDDNNRKLCYKCL
jgi:formylmethanofuran dehydrogenase subunit E